MKRIGSNKGRGKGVGGGKWMMESVLSFDGAARENVCKSQTRREAGTESYSS